MLFSVLKFIGILFEVLLIFNLLIIVHELGHFLAAKWRGLYIERFAIWFGKPIWEKKIGGIWYALGSIPAGGFVKLPQMAPMESLEGESDIPKDQLKNVTPLDKIIVAFAGPLFSFMLAFVFAVLVWKLGKPVGEADGTTTIGYVQTDGPAAGQLKAGDVIKKIDGVEVNRWGGQSEKSVLWRIVGGEADPIHFEVLRDGKPTTADVTPKIEKNEWYERRGLRKAGLAPYSRPMVADTEKDTPAARAGFHKNDLIVGVGDQDVLSEGTIEDWTKENPGKPIPLKVERDGKRVPLTMEAPSVPVEKVFPDSPASRAGLLKGDRILATDGVAVSFPSILIDRIHERNEKPVALTVERDGKTLPLTVIPEVPIEGGGDEPKPSIGIVPADGTGIIGDAYGKTLIDNPLPSDQISDAVGAMVQTFKKVTSPKSKIGVQHMGGPVMMMRIYYMLFEAPDGWLRVLWFSVILNVNLALLNMLPLPVLDGGHITMAIIEAIRRKPMSTKVLEVVQTACALLIMGFMLFVTFYDVQDVFGGKKQPALRFKPQVTEPKPAS